MIRKYRSPMELHSPAFENNGPIPDVYTCEGGNVTPPLIVRNIPGGCRALVLVLDDPDAEEPIVHWLLYDMPTEKAIAEGAARGTPGTNDFSRRNYAGPCPPLDETHRYVFRVFALDMPTGLPPGAPWGVVEEAISGHILAKAELVCRFGRTKQSSQPPDVEGKRADQFLHWI